MHVGRIAREGVDLRGNLTLLVRFGRAALLRAFGQEGVNTRIVNLVCLLLGVAASGRRLGKAAKVDAA